MIVEKINFQSNGVKLFGEFNKPQTSSDTCVIMLHGLTNSRKDCPLIVDLTKKLVSNGFHVFKFDFFGSGKSPGDMQDKTLNILEKNAKDAIKIVKKKQYENIYLWGRSFGGTLVCSLPPDEKIKKRITIAPGVILEKNFYKKWKMLQQIEAELQKQGKTLPGNGAYRGPFELNEKWFEGLKGIDKRIENNLKKLNNMLVIGTTQDKKSTVDNVCKIINLLKEPKKIWMFNCDHDLKGAEKEIMKMCIDWFKKLD